MKAFLFRLNFKRSALLQPYRAGLVFFALIGVLIGLPLELVHANEMLSQEFVEQGRHWVLQQGINELGEQEISISLREHWMLFPDTLHTVLIGRSISTENSIDVWFIPSEDGIAKSVQVPAEIRNDLHKSIHWILENELTNPDRWFAWMALSFTARTLSLTVEHDFSFFERLHREELNLIDLEFRIKAIPLTTDTAQILVLGHETLVAGWNHIVSQIEDEKQKSIWFYAAGDTALTLVGAKVIPLLGQWLGETGKALVQKVGLNQVQMSNAVRGVVDRWRNAIHSKVSAWSARAESLIAKARSSNSKLATFQKKARSSSHPNSGSGEKSASSPMTREDEKLLRKSEYWAIRSMSPSQKVELMLRGMQARQKIARSLANAVSETVTTAKSGVNELKYIAMTQFLQILSEVAARPEELFDPNPIILTQNLAKDRYFMQNFLYMTNETFWMAAISSRFQKQSLAKRVSFCGALAAVDSSAMNFVVKGNVDHGRVALDAGWEIIAGNIQTQIDIASLRYFETLALKKATPSLRFIGYVVASMDQGLGYFGYAKATHIYEGKLHLGEAANDGLANDGLASDLPPKSQFKIIPVFAE